MADGQVKRHHRVAARRVGEREGRGVGAFGVGDAIDPGQRIADILHIGEISGMSDRKIKGDNGVATHGIGDDHCRGVGAFGVGDAVNPSKGVTNVMDIGVVSGMSDRKVKGYNGVAAHGIGKCINCCVVAFGVGNAVDPSEGVTNVVDIGEIGGMSDREIKGDNGVAAYSVDKREGRGVGALGVGDTVNPR